MNSGVKRRITRKISLKGFPVGGDAPISVQTMTNTDTRDVENTLHQIRSIEKIGADIVRIGCLNEEAANALKKIIPAVSIPVVIDIHFHAQWAIQAAKYGASCVRINPGNIGSESNIDAVVEAAKKYNCAIRIGVNAGSLESSLLKKYTEPTADALVESALNHAHILEKRNFDNFKISVKASNVNMAMEAYEKLSNSIDCPLHLGITEAGSRVPGTVKSAYGLGTLLAKGIGDTLRVSLSAPPEEEVVVGFEILKMLKLRAHGLDIISCPSCTRQGFNVISFVQQLEEKTRHIQTPLTITVLGCIVNGIGEARHADLGLIGGQNGLFQLYKHGKPYKRLQASEKDVLIEFIREIETLV